MPVRTKATGKKSLKVFRRDTYQAAKKRETHERILKSARTIARREGLRAASVPRVMNGAGLTVGGFYAHFPSKTAMDVEIVRSMLADPPGKSSQSEDLSGLEWAKELVQRYLSIRHRDNPEGCAYTRLLSEIAAASAEVRLAFSEAMAMRVHAFESQLPPVADISARDRALATMALMIGGVLLARASRGSALSEEFLAACTRWCLPELDFDC